MKIRTDFVTNSSSSSFIITRKSILEGLNDEIKELTTDELLNILRMHSTDEETEGIIDILDKYRKDHMIDRVTIQKRFLKDKRLRDNILEILDWYIHDETQPYDETEFYGVKLMDYALGYEEDFDIDWYVPDDEYGEIVYINGLAFTVPKYYEMVLEIFKNCIAVYDDYSGTFHSEGGILCEISDLYSGHMG